MHRKLLITSISIILKVTVLLSQNTIVSAAGSNNNQTGSVEYVVGHTFFNTVLSFGDGGIGYVFEDTHVFTVLGVNDLQKIKLLTYPNPTIDFLHIKLDQHLNSLNNLSFSIYDINGKELIEGILLKELTRLNLKKIPEGIYLFILKSGGKPIFSTRILKK